MDRYSAYKSVSLSAALFLLSYCWVHVRRDFVGLARQWPCCQDWALDWIARIGALYHTNNLRRDLHDQPTSQEYRACDKALRCQLAEVMRLSGRSQELLLQRYRMVSRSPCRSGGHLLHPGAQWLKCANVVDGLSCPVRRPEWQAARRHPRLPALKCAAVGSKAIDAAASPSTMGGILCGACGKGHRPGGGRTRHLYDSMEAWRGTSQRHSAQSAGVAKSTDGRHFSAKRWRTRSLEPSKFRGDRSPGHHGYVQHQDMTPIR